MNIAFFGSPEIAAYVLTELIARQNDRFRFSLVVTQPDKPAGKKLELLPTPVKIQAIKNNISLFDKDIRIASHELIDVLTDRNIDLAIVYAYGGYIPSQILTIPKHGFVNIHYSLLPKYRGASPIAYPIILGDTSTGVTLFRLNDKLDGGGIISYKKTNITDHENRLELEKKLTIESIPLLMDFIYKVDQVNELSEVTQNEQLATHTSRLHKNDGYIELQTIKKALRNEPLSLAELPILIRKYYENYPEYRSDEYMRLSGKLIYNYYRGLYGWPGIWTKIDTSSGEKRLQLTKLSYSNNLQLQFVKLEGKNEVDFTTFNNSYRIF